MGKRIQKCIKQHEKTSQKLGTTASRITVRVEEDLRHEGQIAVSRRPWAVGWARMVQASRQKTIILIEEHIETLKQPTSQSKGPQHIWKIARRWSTGPQFRIMAENEALNGGDCRIKKAISSLCTHLFVHNLWWRVDHSSRIIVTMWCPIPQFHIRRFPCCFRFQVGE